MDIQHSLLSLQSGADSSSRRLSDMEVLILWAFSKPFYEECRVIDGEWYPICRLKFIRAKLTSWYNNRLMACYKAPEARQYLEQYLDRYEQGTLDPS